MACQYDSAYRRVYIANGLMLNAVTYAMSVLRPHLLAIPTSHHLPPILAIPFVQGEAQRSALPCATAGLICDWSREVTGSIRSTLTKPAVYPQCVPISFTRYLPNWPYADDAPPHLAFHTSYVPSLFSRIGTASFSCVHLLSSPLPFTALR